MAEMLDVVTSTAFWVAVLRIATPLILGTLGVLLCERAGVLNLGIEGIMVAGAFCRLAQRLCRVRRYGPAWRWRHWWARSLGCCMRG